MIKAENNKSDFIAKVRQRYIEIIDAANNGNDEQATFYARELKRFVDANVCYLEGKTSIDFLRLLCRPK
jgi:hypothetical protein